MKKKSFHLSDLVCLLEGFTHSYCWPENNVYYIMSVVEVLSILVSIHGCHRSIQLSQLPLNTMHSCYCWLRPWCTRPFNLLFYYNWHGLLQLSCHLDEWYYCIYLVAMKKIANWTMKVKRPLWRQRNMFGARIKIMWEVQLVDPSIDYLTSVKTIQASW